MLNVVIIGQKWFGAAVYQLCVDMGFNVVRVIAPYSLDRLAVAAGDKLSLMKGNVTAEHIPLDVDLIVCAHAHNYISPCAIAKAKCGALGYHPSLLPRHRGRDAIEWALRFNDPVTGGTVYWLDDGADTGDIAAQDWVWIEPNDNVVSLWRDKLAPLGLKLFAKVFKDILNGYLIRLKQNELVATFEPSIGVCKLNKSSV